MTKIEDRVLTNLWLFKDYGVWDSYTVWIQLNAHECEDVKIKLNCIELELRVCLVSFGILYLHMCNVPYIMRQYLYMSVVH